MKLVGIYLRELRQELRPGGRPAFARDLKTDDSQIERVEGGQDTRTSFLFTFARAVNADLKDIDRLLLSNDNDIVEQEVARALARARVKEVRTMGETKVLDEQDRVLKELIDALRAHPHKMGEWIGYGKRLLDELPGSVPAPGAQPGGAPSEGQPGANKTTG